MLLSRAEAHSPTHGFTHTHFLPSVFSAFCSRQEENCERKREDKDDSETEDRMQADEGVSGQMEESPDHILPIGKLRGKQPCQSSTARPLVTSGSAEKLKGVAADTQLSLHKYVHVDMCCKAQEEQMEWKVLRKFSCSEGGSKLLAGLKGVEKEETKRKLQP